MSPSDPPCVFFNGELIPYDEAKVHVATPGFRFGLSVFEVMPAYWNEAHEQLYVFRLHDHSRRLFNSMKILRMKLRYTVHDLDEAVLELLRANAFRRDVAIRPIVYIGGEGHMDTVEPIEMVILARPPDRPYGPQPGLHLCVSSWGRIADHVLDQQGRRQVRSRLGAPLCVLFCFCCRVDSVRALIRDDFNGRSDD